MATGVLGLPILPVLLPVGSASDCPSEDVIVLLPIMGAFPVLEKKNKASSVQPTLTVQVHEVPVIFGMKLKGFVFSVMD